MGMFDDINIEIECPYCERIVTGFQTKSGACILKEYKIGQKISKSDSYDRDNEPKYFYCYTDCDHGFRLHNDPDFPTIQVTKYVWCEVTIPVINHRISKDISKWEKVFNYRDKEGACYITYNDYSKEDIDRFNADMIDREYDKLWEMMECAKK
jgi:hypothetical protein